MTVVWTEEMKAKAAETRRINKEKKAERLRKKEERLSRSGNEEGKNVPAPNSIQEDISRMGEIPVEVLQRDSDNPAFDWEDSPLQEAIQKAADLKRELDRVMAIVVRRQNPVKNQWTCWTQEQRGNPDVVIAKSVLANCQKRGNDGYWKFRDDGRFVVVDGVRTLKPAFCCNNFCYQVYQAYRVRQKLEQRA